MNNLAVEEQKNGWLTKKLSFKRCAQDIQNFPHMPEGDLKIFFTGSYQYTQAISHLAEMIDQYNNILLEYAQ